MEDLKRWYNQKRQALQAKQAEKRKHMETAAKIRVIYDKMAEDKRDVEGYRDNVNRLKDEDFGTFKGDNKEEKYKAAMENLKSKYDLVIKNIDINLDRLNDKIKEEENLGYQCDPIIGDLEAGINSLAHQIENWFN